MKTWRVVYWSPSAMTKIRGSADISHNKTGAKTTLYNGMSFRSVFECNYAVYLDLRKKVGEIKDWEKEPKYSLDVSGSY